MSMSIIINIYDIYIYYLTYTIYFYLYENIYVDIYILYRFTSQKY